MLGPVVTAFSCFSSGEHAPSATTAVAMLHQRENVPSVACPGAPCAFGTGLLVRPMDPSPELVATFPRQSSRCRSLRQLSLLLEKLSFAHQPRDWIAFIGEYLNGELSASIRKQSFTAPIVYEPLFTNGRGVLRKIIFVMWKHWRNIGAGICNRIVTLPTRNIRCSKRKSPRC